MLTDMRTDMHTDMRTVVCVDMCIDMCTDMHMYGHASRHVHKHVYRYAAGSNMSPSVVGLADSFVAYVCRHRVSVRASKYVQVYREGHKA